MLLAVVLLVVSGALLFPYLSWAFFGSEAVDQGNRGLVVFATRGGSGAYNLNVRQYYDLPGGDARIVFYLTSDSTTRGDGGDYKKPQEISVSATFVGDAFKEGVVCGTSPDKVPRQSFSRLPAGTQRAINVDLISESNSAINYRGELSQASVKQIDSGLYAEFRASLWTHPSGTYQSERSDSWAESCTVKGLAVWRLSNQPMPLSTQHQTLLPPQINFTSMGEKSDRQAALWNEILIKRNKGMVLRESYPQLNSSDTEWEYSDYGWWMGKQGETSNIGYTNQPVYIFDDRAGPAQQAVILTLMGAVLGLMGQSLIYLLSRGFDQLFGHREM